MSGAFLGLARNQPLKRGGYGLMRRMAGTDPLFRLDWSTLTVVRASTDDPKGKKMAHPDVGSQIDLDKGKHANAKEIFRVAVGVGVGPVDLLRCSPNIFTSPSEASKKEAVSTPSLVTDTSANDCMCEGISKDGSLGFNGTDVVTLTVSKYGVTVAIPSYFVCPAVVSYAPDRTAASLFPGLALARERRAREEPS